MKKAIYLIVLLALTFNITAAEKWEMIDNINTVTNPNGKQSIFVISKLVELNSTIFNIDKAENSIIKSEDNCVNWDSCIYAPFNNLGIRDEFYDLVKSGNSLFVPSDSGKLYHSFDNGETWSFTSFAEKDNHPIKHLKFVNDNVGFVGVINHNILSKTTDGGKTWEPLPLSNDVFPEIFSFTNFIPIDESNIYIVGYELIQNQKPKFVFFKTGDGGKIWEQFESELFEETEFAAQEYNHLSYINSHFIVESGFKSGQYGHTRLMKSLDFKKWEPAFISDTISGGKRIKSFQIYDDRMFGYGERILIISTDQGNTWFDLYDKEDEFYDGNSDGFVYIDNYGYAQSNLKFTDSEGILRTDLKMFRYKFDFETSVESVTTNLNVYPNPSKTEMNIDYNKPINSIVILDLNGKILLSTKSISPSFQQVLEINFLTAGTYFIKINDNIYKRFIKE